MDICSSMFARKKNIPPRNRGEIRQSWRGGGCPGDRDGVGWVLIHADSATIFPGAAPILIHAGFAAIFPGTARIAVPWHRKIPAPETGTGDGAEISCSGRLRRKSNPC